MSIEAIKNIKETEEKAQQLVKDAQKQAKQIVADAGVQAAKILEEATASAEAQAAQELKRAKDEAKDQFDAIIAKTATECDAIKQSAQTRQSDAAKIILGRIVKPDGNS